MVPFFLHRRQIQYRIVAEWGAHLEAVVIFLYHK